MLYRDGSMLAMKGNLKEAIAVYSRCIQLSPRFALAHYGLGKSYLYLENRLPDAVRELKIAIECDRKLARGHFYLGLAYMFQKKYEHAIHSLYKAYQIDRNFTESLYNIGSIYDIMGNQSKAAKFYSDYFRIVYSDKRDPF